MKLYPMQIMLSSTRKILDELPVSWGSISTALYQMYIIYYLGYDLFVRIN